MKNSAGHNDTVLPRQLSGVDDGKEMLIGNPESGVLVSVPPLGGALMRALTRWAMLEEAEGRALQEP